MNRNLLVWAVTMLVVGFPTAFALPYLLPDDTSRLVRGLASAGQWTVTFLIAEVVARVFARRGSRN